MKKSIVMKVIFIVSMLVALTCAEEAESLNINQLPQFLTVVERDQRFRFPTFLCEI